MGSGSQNCPRVHRVCCSLHARIVHTARTHRARCTHALCTLHARTHCAYCTHARCTLTHCARCTHALCTLHAHTVHAARTHCARFTHALCTLHARMVHAAHTHPLCTLHARIVHAARPHLAHCAVQWTCIELVPMSETSGAIDCFSLHHRLLIRARCITVSSHRGLHWFQALQCG